MATDVSADVNLTPLTGSTRTLAEWTTTFHLVVVVVDPFTYESSWILDTAVRILRVFSGADCRVAFLVTGEPDEARQFLGPLAKEFLVFCDPSRDVVKALGLERLPAFVHLNQNHAIETTAEGWQPERWRAAADHLGSLMSWHPPSIPASGDPAPFEGTPAFG